METDGNGTNPLGPPKPLRLFMFAAPRTASNLFLKLLSEHPDIVQYHYPFLFPYFTGPDAQFSVIGEYKPNDAEKAQMEDMKNHTYQFVLDKLEQDIAEAEAAVRHWHSCELRHI
jgi:hypothetical protein